MKSSSLYWLGERYWIQCAVRAVVVVILRPGDKLLVESVYTAQVEFAYEELIAYCAKKSFYFTFCSAVAYRGVAESYAQTRTDRREFGSRVNGAVVDVEHLRQATFIECFFKGSLKCQ